MNNPVKFNQMIRFLTMPVPIGYIVYHGATHIIIELFETPELATSCQWLLNESSLDIQQGRSVVGYEHPYTVLSNFYQITEYQVVIARSSSDDAVGRDQIATFIQDRIKKMRAEKAQKKEDSNA